MSSFEADADAGSEKLNVDLRSTGRPGVAGTDLSNDSTPTGRACRRANRSTAAHAAGSAAGPSRLGSRPSCSWQRHRLDTAGRSDRSGRRTSTSAPRVRRRTGPRRQVAMTGRAGAARAVLARTSGDLKAGRQQPAAGDRRSQLPRRQPEHRRTPPAHHRAGRSQHRRHRIRQRRAGRLQHRRIRIQRTQQPGERHPHRLGPRPEPAQLAPDRPTGRPNRPAIRRCLVHGLMHPDSWEVGRGALTERGCEEEGAARAATGVRPRVAAEG